MFRRRIAGVTLAALAVGAVGLALVSSGAAADTMRGSPARIAVDLEGTGSGQVVSTPALIDCPDSRCVAAAETGQQYTLTATPDAGSSFVGFVGPCDSVAGNSCTFVAQSGSSVFRVGFDKGADAGSTACDKAKAKLAAAKERLKRLQQGGGSDRSIAKAKQKVKKAKKKKKKKCAA